MRYEMCDVKWALENHCESHSADPTSHINNGWSGLRMD